MVQRSIDQKLRLRNLDARHGRIESGEVIKSRKEVIGDEGGKGICYQWKEKASVREETNAVSDTRVMIVRNRHQKPLHPPSHQHQEVRPEKGASEAGVRLGRPTDSRAKTS